MLYADDKISIEHDGQEYSAAYKVDNGVVSVMMRGRDGARREASTFVGGSSAESVAKSLLGELLKDLALL